MSKRVLIVEDEILVALDLEDALTDAGYKVVGIAADRHEAMALACDVDVALVDVNLRDGPTGVAIGFTLAEDHGVQVLFLTANPSSVGDTGRRAVGCLSKPCAPASICEAIEFATQQEARRSAPTGLIRFN